STARIGTTRRIRPVTAAMPASRSQGSWPLSSSHSESTPLASRARASARYSPGSSNRRGIRTPIFNTAPVIRTVVRLDLDREDHDHAKRQPPDEHQHAPEDGLSAAAGA